MSFRRQQSPVVPRLLLLVRRHACRCPLWCCRYEPGALAAIWPLGRVVLSLHAPFLTNDHVASTMLGDVSYPETPMTLRDLNLTWIQSVQNLREAARRRIRWESAAFSPNGAPGGAGPSHEPSRTTGRFLDPPQETRANGLPVLAPQTLELPEPLPVRHGRRGAPAGAGRGAADPPVDGGRHLEGGGQVRFLGAEPVSGPSR